LQNPELTYAPQLARMGVAALVAIRLAPVATAAPRLSSVSEYYQTMVSLTLFRASLLTARRRSIRGASSVGFSYARDVDGCNSAYRPGRHEAGATGIRFGPCGF